MNDIQMKKLFVTTASLLALVGCGQGEKEFDATGTFEAVETVVAAEQSGRLLTFDISEGDEVARDRQVGLVDTTQLELKLQQLHAMKAVYQSQKPDREAQIAATRQQLAKAQQERRRYEELVADSAAPRKMLDDATSQVLVLQKQLDAQVSTLNTQLSTLDSQLSMVDVQISQLEDQKAKCRVASPTDGVVLEKYVEQGEYVTTGKSLFKVADVGQMHLRAYITSAQLQGVKIGQRVKVFANYGDGKRMEYEGTVSWISSQSEFTPKTILTDDERADLVYAVKIAVKNDGYIKIGMYGEVAF